MLLNPSTSPATLSDASLAEASLELARRVEEQLGEAAPDEAEVASLLEDLTLSWEMRSQPDESTLDESTLDLEESALDLEESALDLEESAPDLEESAPDLEENAPDLEKSAPGLEESTSVPVVSTLDPAVSVLELEESALDLLDRALRFCREEDWEQGVDILLKVPDAPGRPKELPGIYYSYLGYGIAHTEGRVKEGLRLCRHAVEIEFYQPESFANLARTCLLAEDRAAAAAALDEGLRVDREHPELLALIGEVGTRRPPVLPFLPRGSLLNRLLGQIRHDLLTRRAAA